MGLKHITPRPPNRHHHRLPLLGRQRRNLRHRRLIQPQHRNVLRHRINLFTQIPMVHRHQSPGHLRRLRRQPQPRGNQFSRQLRPSLKRFPRLRPNGVRIPIQNRLNRLVRSRALKLRLNGFPLVNHRIRNPPGQDSQGNPPSRHVIQNGLHILSRTQNGLKSGGNLRPLLRRLRHFPLVQNPRLFHPQHHPQLRRRINLFPGQHQMSGFLGNQTQSLDRFYRPSHLPKPLARPRCPRLRFP